MHPDLLDPVRAHDLEVIVVSGTDYRVDSLLIGTYTSGNLR